MLIDSHMQPFCKPLPTISFSFSVLQKLDVVVKDLQRVLSLQTDLNKKHALQESPTNVDFLEVFFCAKLY